ncbi:MAG: hypothetical protein DRP02_12650 [Candidatus Gerdarchaeota archaeon]|uniref:Uncharacterized protein n=1 Tax=candidate division Kazan bacterium TaxID=2202143 RepID=A0A420ZBH4_UNCK3|nr:MAG: hypothetical protein DRH29_04920 [candidate division Kazan bacterium]RLI68406.1 MAG: hypothetical protein DRP02_12650 [Candidatus Gerdarchaeota archaeon]
METIKLQELAELKAQENLPEIPELVQRYLDTEERQVEGEHFRIVIDEKSDPKPGAGIAYSNALRIEKRNGELWSQVYSTGMMQYRGAYNYEIDDWDLSLNNPTILEESNDEVLYAIETGVGNVKVYRFRNKDNNPAMLVVFNIRDYKKTQERIELLQKVINDAGAFCSYVSKSLGRRWDITESATPADDVKVLLLDHADRDYDAISDFYQLYIWVKGKGIGATKIYKTGLYHPGGKFYRIGVDFDVSIINRGRNFLNLAIEVYNRRQQWKEVRNFHVEWKGTNVSTFEREVEKAMEKVVESHQHDHPLFKPTRITESVIDTKREIAAWILFEQIDTDRLSEHGEGWLGDQFRYSLWVMKAGEEEPHQVYEDHAYIRPYSKSELTGTRGRDCTLKDLRLEGNTIKVLHPEGERVEEQEWKDFIFSI